jgi:hypothetical protein
LRRFQRRVSLMSRLALRGGRRFEFTLHQGYTRETLPVFRAANPAFRAQFIFIDGGHSIETIRGDWETCSQLVDVDGAIFMDDFYGDPKLAERFGCNTLVDGLRADARWAVEVLPETDTIEELGTIQIVRAKPAHVS